jgi:CrcB protein
VQTLTQALYVAVGSVMGGLLRWLVAVWFARWFGAGFPYGTLFINLSGSLFLGWFMTVFTERILPNGWLAIRPENLRLMVAVGFTGAYTTFSTFEYETHSLIRNGESLSATIYVFVSLFLGLLAVRLGIVLAGWGQSA